MPLKCPKGTSTGYRFKKGTRLRLGGCLRKNRFVKVLEVKNIPKKENYEMKR